MLLAATGLVLGGQVLHQLELGRRYSRAAGTPQIFEGRLDPQVIVVVGRLLVAFNDEANDARRGPMRVVSGPIGRERVHFEAPPAVRLPREIDAFLQWFADPPVTDPLIIAGLAHLWLVTIHPFDDGNGRIARAVADMALARADGSAYRFYSMSSQIREESLTGWSGSGRRISTRL